MKQSTFVSAEVSEFFGQSSATQGTSMGHFSGAVGHLHYSSVLTAGLVHCQLCSGYLPAQSVHSIHIS